MSNKTSQKAEVSKPFRVVRDRGTVNVRGEKSTVHIRELGLKRGPTYVVVVAEKSEFARALESLNINPNESSAELRSLLMIPGMVGQNGEILAKFRKIKT